MILGITGGTGSGKTTLLKCIEAQGGLVIDCDAVYHRLLQEDPALLDSIGQAFPGTVKDGTLDRKALGAIVFQDEAALLRLNAITHAAVKAEVLRLLEDRLRLTAIDAIGLFEGGLAELCDITVAVTAPEVLRLERLMARDGISEEYARSRIRAQKQDTEFSNLCDCTLENNGTEAEFQAKCLAFLQSRDIIEPSFPKKERFL